MNLELTEEQKMIQQAAKDYAERELITDVLERDRTAEFPTHHIKALAELGFMGMLVDPKYDGGGMDTISYVLAMEEISKIDSSVSVVMSVNNSLVCHGIEQYGTEEQKQKFLKPLARGEVIGAFLLSEPEAGSDATSQQTLAEDKGDYYLVNGTKNWITSANSASTYILIAQTYPEKKHKGINAFIVDKHSPGITLGPHEDKMGMRSSDTHSVMFNDVKST
jgi:alkylation response protein AidB-like acyl-CoA dehydrogenase